MIAIDLKHLRPFEEQWVAVAPDWKVAGHAVKLVDLRLKLGAEAASYSYFFVPSAKAGYCGPCRT